MDDNAIRAAFERDGFVLLPGFYDVETQIQPIQKSIGEIIALVAEDAKLEVECTEPQDAMTHGFTQLIAHDRSLGARVYDAVKQLPAFVRLTGDTRNEAIYQTLRPGALPGLARNGAGIRIDNPHEDKFRAYWHQEFPSQLRSIDGAVFWSPLIPVTKDMGPVEIACGSHNEGLVPVYKDVGVSDRSGAYAVRMEGEQALIAKYKTVAPLTRPGDLVIMDYLTLHQSGQNISNRPRWSMQFRYFNYTDPIGRRLKWTGAFQQGMSIETICETVRNMKATSNE